MSCDELCHCAGVRLLLKCKLAGVVICKKKHDREKYKRLYEGINPEFERR